VAVASPDRGQRTTWVAGLLVAAGAGLATAHGLYQVAAAARVAAPIAWLYPLITDGLALVAYAATARLHRTGRRYAAAIVVLAAGLSGLAQAVYLAGGLGTRAVAPVGLRFGVGAWPAIAAALTAHLLHLIGSDRQAAPTVVVDERQHQDAASNPAPPASANPPYNQPSNPSTDPAYNAASHPAVQPRTNPPRTTPPVQPETAAEPYNPAPGVNTEPRVNGHQRPAERARTLAEVHRDRTGALPTVTELMRLADVARGTAGTVLKSLREQRPALHLVNQPPPKGTHP
jgi:hypothetical protein